MHIAESKKHVWVAKWWRNIVKKLYVQKIHQKMTSSFGSIHLSCYKHDRAERGKLAIRNETLLLLEKGSNIGEGVLHAKLDGNLTYKKKCPTII